jgi:hypothetical protein
LSEIEPTLEPVSATARARLPAASLLSGVLVVWVAVYLVPGEPARAAWAGAASLLGLVSPVIGYRLYGWLESRVSPGTGPAGIDRAWIRATVYALAVTGAAALLCAIAFLLTRDPTTHLGPAMHVLLTGALWPSSERRNAFASRPASLPSVE